MASYDAAAKAILDKIESLAQAIEPGDSVNAARLAAAMTSMAEARAWLIASNQPHGGARSFSE